MRRALLPLLLCALVAGCGGGGKSAADTFAQSQAGACAKVQQQVAAIKRPNVTAGTSTAVRRRESKALQRYALKVDRTLILGLTTLHAVPAPAKVARLRERWLKAVGAALHARLELDAAPPKLLQKASKLELKRRRIANALAGELQIANGCTLTY
jgi:hypothetical protein